MTPRFVFACVLACACTAAIAQAPVKTKKVDPAVAKQQAAAAKKAERAAEIEKVKKRIEFDIKAAKEEEARKAAAAKAAAEDARKKAEEAEKARLAAIEKQKQAERDRKAREAECVIKPVMSDADMRKCRGAYR